MFESLAPEPVLGHSLPTRRCTRLYKTVPTFAKALQIFTHSHSKHLGVDGTERRRHLTAIGAPYDGEEISYHHPKTGEQHQYGAAQQGRIS